MTNEPRDEELEKYLKGGDPLSRRYRAESCETASPELDDVVLARARVAVQPRRRSRWLMPLTLAATVVLAVNLGWNLREHAAPPVPAIPADAPSAPPMAQREQDLPQQKAKVASEQREEVRARREASAAADYFAAPPAESPPAAEAVAPRSNQPALAAGAVGALAEHEELTRQATESAARAHTGAWHGWWLTSDGELDYGIGLANFQPHSGNNSLVVKSKSSAPRGVGTLMHRIPAAEYRGLYVMFEAWIRTRDVVDWAGLWMRVDDDSGKTLRLEDMRGRGLRGDQGWQRHSIVLDVPPEAAHIAFGLLLNGRGKAQIDTARIEAVGEIAGTVDAQARIEPPPVRTFGFEERQLPPREGR